MRRGIQFDTAAHLEMILFMADDVGLHNHNLIMFQL